MQKLCNMHGLRFDCFLFNVLPGLHAQKALYAHAIFRDYLL